MVCVHSRLFTESTEPVTSDKVVTAVAVESRRIRSLGKMFNFIKMFIKFFVFCFFARCGDVPRIFGGFGINTVSYRMSIFFVFSDFFFTMFGTGVCFYVWWKFVQSELFYCKRAQVSTTLLITHPFTTLGAKSNPPPDKYDDFWFLQLLIIFLIFVIWFYGPI